MFQTGWPSLGQPAFAPKPLSLSLFNHQIATKLFRLEPLGQNKLAHPGLRNAEHPRDLCCGQRINMENIFNSTALVETFQPAYTITHGLYFIASRTAFARLPLKIAKSPAGGFHRWMSKIMKTRLDSFLKALLMAAMLATLSPRIYAQIPDQNFSWTVTGTGTETWFTDDLVYRQITLSTNSPLGNTEGLFSAVETDTAPYSGQCSI